MDLKHSHANEWAPQSVGRFPEEGWQNARPVLLPKWAPAWENHLARGGGGVAPVNRHRELSREFQAHTTRIGECGDGAECGGANTVDGGCIAGAG